jgi:hypothetical protein
MAGMEATSVRFAAAARTLGEVARRRGLQVPSFRSPPRLRGADRSLRRAASGSCTVSVRLKGRPWSAVTADMIEGVVASNRLTGPAADRTRTALWTAVEAEARRSGPVSVPTPGPTRTVGPDRAASPPARRFPARRPAPPEADAPPRRRPPLRTVPRTPMPSTEVA